MEEGRNIREPLLKREGDANDEIERSGKSVLQLAIEEKADRKTIESVIRSGADINLQDSFGNTPMISLTSVGMYEFESMVLVWNCLMISC